jgi:hypothetical protein
MKPKTRLVTVIASPADNPSPLNRSHFSIFHVPFAIFCLLTSALCLLSAACHHAVIPIGGWQPPSPRRWGRGGWFTLGFLIFCLLTSPFSLAGTYSGGSGTPENPYQISTVADWQELIATSADWDKNFILLNDIDFGGANLTPVGSFSGIFDGQHYVLRNAVINLPGNDSVGLFATVSVGRIQNLGVDDISVTGGQYVGSLCGSNTGTISGCYASGFVNGANCVGGLCGLNDGSIRRCYATGPVNDATDPFYGGHCTGGLCGLNSGTISQCYATGAVGGWDRSGGLCGSNSGEYAIIEDCYGTGAVNGIASMGGLCGFNQSTIISCYATGPVHWGEYSGGFCGDSEFGVITGCFWDMETSGLTSSWGGNGKTTAEMKTRATFIEAGWDFIGEWANGLHDHWQIQANDYPRFTVPAWTLSGKGTPDDPYEIANDTDLGKVWLRPSACYRLTAHVNLTGVSWSSAVIPEFSGTLDGWGFVISGLTINQPRGRSVGLFGTIAAGGQIGNLEIDNVTVTGRYSVGGLCGVSEGTIRDCFVTGTISGNYEVGGLCGRNVGTVRNCYAMDTVNGSNTDVGGLCGINHGTILSSDSTGSITLFNFDPFDWYASNIGGLCGSSSGTISGCSAGGNIKGTGKSDSHDIGGLCGFSSGAITDSCAAVDISGFWGSQHLGGLCGNNGGRLSNCYATGSVPGNDSNGVGGLCGTNGGMIRICYATGFVGGYTSFSAGGLCGENHGRIIQSYTTAPVDGYSASGGFCGINGKDGVIQNCYARGDIKGYFIYNLIGGFCAQNDGTIMNCYATGFVGGSSNVGGFCGSSGDQIIGCFWNVETSGLTDGVGNRDPDPNGVTGKTTVEMKILSLFTNAGWDFVGELANGTADGWRMCADGVDYPRLSWEFSGGGDFDCPDGVGMEDLAYLVKRWLADTPEEAGAADANGDGKVNLEEFTLLSSAPWRQRYSGGWGTAQDPYQIGSAADFNAAGQTPSDWDKRFILIADLDFQDIALSSIGIGEIPFSGDFNGNGHRILNLTQTQYDNFTQAPFDRVDASGQIRNLHIRSANILEWEQTASGLVRYNFGAITNCTIENSIVSGTTVGGMVIWNYGSLTDCSTTSEPPVDYNTAAVMGQEAGGLVAWNYGTMTNCSGNGNVLGNIRGGLVAINYGVMKHCWIAADLFEYLGGGTVGGLVARNYGILMNCSVTGTVGRFFNLVGGLVAENYGSILRCFFDGRLDIWGGGGGLVGYNSGWIRDCYSRGLITTESWLAGLVYKNIGHVIRCYSDCTVDSADGHAACLIYTNQDRCGEYCVWVEYDGMLFCDHTEWKCLDNGEVISSFCGFDGVTDAGWDFVGETTNGTEDVWRMCTDGVDYPRLSWEFPDDGDFACPDGVGMEDLVYLAGRWLVDWPNGVGAADTNTDDKVDIADFAVLAARWLRESP